MKEDDADDAEDKEETPEEEEQESPDADASEEEAEDSSSEDSSGDSDDKEAEEAEEKPFVCNLKFKKIGCYADKGKKDKPLASFLESDAELGGMDKKDKIKGGSKKFNSELPKFACKCANDALNGGNAIFGLQNLAECWSGPDDSQYDKDGASEDCVTFDMAKCDENSEICAGKKHANFMYYVDSPEHTKTQEEVNTELAEEQKKVEAEKAKAEKEAKEAKAKEEKKEKKEKKKKGSKKSKKKKN
jgi:hypothetical protein